jgi:toxin FitB
MNVVDTCGWLEFFAGDDNKEFFRAPLEDVESLIVPSISVYEVCRKLVHWQGETAAQQALSFMKKGQIVNLSADQLLLASVAAQTYKLAMADAIIWQTAQVHQAKLYTQDIDLEGLPNVKFKAKPLIKEKP